MSDPVSNAEVEDVLASIRRLVSGEKPHEQAHRASVTAKSMTEGEASQNASQPQSDADRTKLVLTPALRVMSPEDEAPKQADEPDSQAQLAPPEIEADASPDQDALAAENARTAARLVALTAENRPDAETPDTETPEAETLDAETPDAESTETRDSLSSPDAIIVEAKENPMSLSAKIAALEAVIGKRQDTWEPDGVATEDAYSGTQAPTLAWEDHVAESTDASPALPEPELLEAEEYEDEEEVASEPEPPIFGPDDRLGDFGPVAATHEPEQDAAFTEAAEEDALDLTEEPDILDEEALRDMVAEIVREELQGALGERITRNVRKLVRREIQRALAAHDLE